MVLPRNFNLQAYISQCGYVHCDIAARNVWLFREVSGGVFVRRAKIAGFGKLNLLSLSLA